jgi:hypothetical protein
MAWQQRVGGHGFRLASLREVDGTLVVTCSWLDAEGHVREWNQLLRLRSGKIIDIEDR